MKLNVLCIAATFSIAVLCGCATTPQERDGFKRGLQEARDVLREIRGVTQELLGVKGDIDDLRNKGRGFREAPVQERLPIPSNEDRLTGEKGPIQGPDEEDLRINSKAASELKVRQGKSNLAQKCSAPTKANGKDGEVTAKKRPIEDRCAKQVG